MGGCMSYQRFKNRNGMGKDGYVPFTSSDLGRMEKDQRDDFHLNRYAALAGVTTEQVKIILDSFLDADCEGQTCYTVEYHDRDCTSLCHVKPHLPPGARPEPAD